MTVTREEAAQELLDRMAAVERLVPFMKYTKPNFFVARFHELIAEALEKVERGELKRVMIQAPRRHGKSEEGSRRFPAWYLGRNPKNQIINVSYGDETATDLGRDVRNIIASPEYRALGEFEPFKQVSLRQDSQAANRFHTNEGGIYVSTSINGTVTGKGADVLLIDDPHKNMEEAANPTLQEKTYRFYTDTLVPTLMPNGAIVIIGSPWCPGDLMDRILQESKEPWVVLTFPALGIENDPLGRQIDEALSPQWASAEFLMSQRQSMSTRAFEAEFQMVRQKKVIGALFDQDNIDANRVSGAPELVQVSIGVDPAGSDDPTADETGIVGAGRSVDGHYYVLVDDTLRGKPNEWGNKSVSAYERLEADDVTGEANYGGDMVEAVIKTAADAAGITVPFKKVNASRGKIVRAEPVADLAARGLLHMVGRHPKLEKEMTTYTGAKGQRSPNRFDAMVWAVSRLMTRTSNRVTRL